MTNDQHNADAPEPDTRGDAARLADRLNVEAVGFKTDGWESNPTDQARLEGIGWCIDWLRRQDAARPAPAVAEGTDVEAEEDAGPECALCGKTTCPDADLPEFTAPRACVLTPVYEELRYDRCEYGCGRDITITTVRNAARILADRLAQRPTRSEP